MKLDEMKLAEFLDLGILQEINRQILHPLGMGMAVTCDVEGNPRRLGPIFKTEAPEGFMFETIDTDRAGAYRKLILERTPDRVRRYGCRVQGDDQTFEADDDSEEDDEG